MYQIKKFNFPLVVNYNLRRYAASVENVTIRA